VLKVLWDVTDIREDPSIHALRKIFRCNMSHDFTVSSIIALFTVLSVTILMFDGYDYLCPYR
jgi:hypothetical protein